jgi:hypothetical protein
MQDGARAHAVRSTTKALKRLCFILPGCAPDSPDLDPIEMIWTIMKRRVKREAPQTKQKLQKVIAGVWNELNQEFPGHVILSFNKRLRMHTRGSPEMRPRN